MQAEWAHLACRLSEDEAAPWKNIWWFNLREVYGDLCERDLLYTTCRYQRLKLNAGPSQVQQEAMAAWGSLDVVPLKMQWPEMTPAREKRIALAAYDGVPPPELKPVWVVGREEIGGAQVAQRRLWFEAAMEGGGSMHQRSTYASEDEAVAWATQGLVRIQQVVRGTTITGPSSFKQQFPSLDSSKILETRSHLPREWQVALQDGTAATWGSEALPRDLFDDAPVEARGKQRRKAQQEYGIRYAMTLVQRAPTRICKLRVKHVYAALLASNYATPRVFDTARGEEVARHAHAFDNIQEPFRTKAIARAMRCVTHKAVPPEWAETAFKVALSALPFGPNKGHICKRDSCPCGSGAPETVGHTFHTCPRARRLWDMILEQWGSVTGETKVRAADPRVVIFGERSGTWLDEAEQSDFAGLEEPFAVIHKATLHVLLQERNRDAAPGARTRRTAMQLYQRVAKLVTLVVTDKMCACITRRHADEGASLTRFRRSWEAPGFVTISEANEVQLIFFMKHVTRERWKGKKLDTHAKRHRTQQHAPPTTLPQGTASIYTDGSAEPRQLGKPPAPAGFGACAIVGGQGHEQADGHLIWEVCGQITMSMRNVSTVTNNLAELVAFTRALQWAARKGDVKYVVMRYDSLYAAMVASGTWKAKKHKAMAMEARHAWTTLKKRLGDRVWLRHVKGHSGHRWNNRADSLADAGRQGMHVDVNTR